MIFPSLQIGLRSFLAPKIKKCRCGLWPPPTAVQVDILNTIHFFSTGAFKSHVWLLVASWEKPPLQWPLPECHSDERQMTGSVQKSLLKLFGENTFVCVLVCVGVYKQRLGKLGTMTYGTLGTAEFTAAGVWPAKAHSSHTHSRLFG